MEEAVLLRKMFGCIVGVTRAERAASRDMRIRSVVARTVKPPWRWPRWREPCVRELRRLAQIVKRHESDKMPRSPGPFRHVP